MRHIPFFKKKKPTIIAQECGHATKQTGVVSAFEETTTTQMPLDVNGNTDWCLHCISQMAIRCAWCAKPIFIGDVVTLYSTKNTEMPPHAVKHEDAFVGCGRTRCADTGADYAGRWAPDQDGNGMVVTN